MPPTFNEGLRVDNREADIEVLDFLVKSPAFAALKRLLEGTRQECISNLATSKETQEIFFNQGRLNGIQTLWQLPEILVKKRDMKAKESEEQEKKYPVYKQI